MRINDISPCTTSLRVHDDDDDDTHKTARGAPTRCKPPLVPGPPTGLCISAMIELSTASGPRRAVVGLDAENAFQSEATVHHAARVTHPPQPSMVVIGRAGVYNLVESDTPTRVYHESRRVGLDVWVVIGSRNHPPCMPLRLVHRRRPSPLASW